MTLFLAAVAVLPVITLSPTGFVIGPYPADQVLVWVSVPEGSAFWCPEVEVVWHPDWAKSKHSEDCAPEEESLPYSYSMRGPASGAYTEPVTIMVTLTQSGKTFRKGLELRVR